jgi:hypothetical protein
MQPGITAVNEPIDATKLYPFAAACRLMPSPLGKKHLSIETLHRWVASGTMQAEFVERGSRRYWFVRGSELLRLMQTTKHTIPGAPAVRSESRRSAAIEAAAAHLRQMGLKV